MSTAKDNTAHSFTTSAAEESRTLRDVPTPANENDALAPADAVLDVEDVARLLHVGRNTIYELVGRNEIPHRRLRKQIRFSRAVILRWLGGNDVPR